MLRLGSGNIRTFVDTIRLREPSVAPNLLFWGRRRLLPSSLTAFILPWSFDTMSQPVFKRLPAGLQCLRQQGPQAWRSQSVRLFSTSPEHNVEPDTPKRNMSDALGKPPVPASTSKMSHILNTAGRPRQQNDLLARATRFAQDPAIYDLPPAHHLHVYSHKRNTVITLTKPNREVMLTMGNGNMGFRHASKKGYDPAHQLSSYMLAQIQERGWLHEIRALEIVFRDFGPGREAFTKLLIGNEGKNIARLVTHVSDATRLKFGGTRSPQVRRL